MTGRGVHCESCGFGYRGELSDRAAQCPKCGPAGALAECVEAFGRWLVLDNADQVLAALGAIAANRLAGDPVWLLFVGAAGSGKTETVLPLAGLPYVFEAATITEPALLSGTSTKERETGATGGLLRQVGDFGVLLVKDFSGVLSMHRDSRASVLAALREVYDGSWSRPVGTGGGRVLKWAGKCGFIGAVTPSIDRHHAVMGALGERFVLYRLPAPDPRAQARRRLANRGHEAAMRAELAHVVQAVLDRVDAGAPPRALVRSEEDRLVDLASFVARGRTAVERDGYDREVSVMPVAEAPGRLVGALGQLLAGVEAVGARTAEAWRIVERAAWGCVPDIRRTLLEHLHQAGSEQTARVVAATGIPKTTAERALEDMALLGLVEVGRSGKGATAAKLWALTSGARDSWPASPEASGDVT